MSNTVQIRYRQPLGAGFDGNGRPVQGKQNVRGRITVTSAKSGESLKPADLGLSKIDDLQLTVTEAMGSASGVPRVAHYSHSAQEFYILEDGVDSNSVGNDFVVSFDAFGDSAANVEHL